MPEASSDRVIVFDTTLRDGEQAPGASMALEQKLRVARVLTTLGVDVLEAGFPAASPGDFRAGGAGAAPLQRAAHPGPPPAARGETDPGPEARRPATAQGAP